jgi:hypothetical protein
MVCLLLPAGLWGGDIIIPHESSCRSFGSRDVLQLDLLTKVDFM